MRGQRKHMRGIIYCRVSTDKEEQASSLSRQKQELTDLAKRHHITIMNHIMEKESGYKIEREGIFQFLDDLDRKSTRLNSSHVAISYAVFCLKKNTQPEYQTENKQQ